MHKQNQPINIWLNNYTLWSYVIGAVDNGFFCIEAFPESMCK